MVFIYKVQRGAVVPEVIEIDDSNAVVEVIDDLLDAFLQNQALSEASESFAGAKLDHLPERSSWSQIDSPKLCSRDFFKELNDAEVLKEMQIQKKEQEEAILAAREQKMMQERHLIDVANVKAFIAINRDLEIPPAPPVVPRAPAKQAAKYVPKRARAVLTLD